MKWHRCFFLLLYFPLSSVQAQDFKEINSDSLFQGLSFLDSHINEYNVFFSGENHSYAEANNKFQSEFFEYLIQNAGVRHFLMEAGYSRGKIMNDYVQTGDSAVYEMLKVGSFPVFVELYEALRKLYLKYSDSGISFMIHGIDVERSSTLPIFHLESLLPKDVIHYPDKIFLSIESIKAIAETNRVLYKRAVAGLPSSYSPNSYMESFSLYNSVDTIVSEFRAHEDIYRNFLTENYEEFEKVIVTLEEGRTWRQYNRLNLIQRNIYRENMMLRNFTRLLDSFPDGKFYSQMGRCHTSKGDNEDVCGWLGFSSLVNRIRNMENPHVKDKVLSLGIFYNMDVKLRDEKENPELYTYLNKTPNGKIHLYKTQSTDTVLSQRFTFLLIDRKSTTTELTYYNKKKEDSHKSTKSSYDDYTYMIEIGFQATTHSANLSNLNNNFLSSAGINVFDPLMTSGGFYFNTADFAGNSGRLFGMGVNFLSSQTGKLSNDSSVRLSGYNIDLRIAYITRLLRNVYLTFGADAGFFQRKLVVSESFQISSVNGFVEKGSYDVIFRNPATLITPHLSFKIIALGGIFFNFEGGYSLDISDQNWRRNRKLLSTSPETSWSAPYFGFKLGFGSLLD
jgi:hypothetical protein